MTILRTLAADARSYLRPIAKEVKSMAKSGYNDLHRLLRTGREVHEPIGRQWRRVLGRSQKTLHQLPPAGSPRVLFATSYGFADPMLAFEPIVAMALRMRGADPIILSCDKSLPACEWNRCGNHNPSPGAFGKAVSPRTSLERCRVCTENIQDAFGLLPLQRTALSRYLRPEDVQRAVQIASGVHFDRGREFVHQDIAVGEQAYASTVRSLLRGTLNDDAETRWLYNRYLVAAILIAELTERLLKDVKPDRVVAVHGVYVTHGTICEVARKLGIHPVVYGNPLRHGSVWLSHHDTYHRTLVSEPPSHWEDIDLTPTRRNRIAQYLQAKRLGGREYAAYHRDSIEDEAAIRRELNLRDDVPIISLFTNVLWDAQLFFKHNAFPTMLEWLFETIRHFARREDLQLVIRVHPAESKGGRGTLPTNQPILPEIEREFPVLPPNVRVIRSESKINSYTLAEMSHAALVYGARMGVEIAMLGVPLIVAGESFNRGKGYSYDVENPAQYFELLERIQELPRHVPEAVERAHKYAYHYFFRIMMDFPLYSVADAFHVADARLEFSDLAALEPGKCPALDVICQGIMDGQTLFLHDCEEVR
jgi:hypothetical protein